MPGPSHNTTKIGKNPAVISDAGFSIAEEEILLSTDVEQDMLSADFNQLANHSLFSVVSLHGLHEHSYLLAYN